MKNKAMQFAAIATLLSCTAISPLFASAEEGETEEKEKVVNYVSNGMVTFIPNEDSQGPVDPTDPDPEKPVNPVDPTDPEGPKPGTGSPLGLDFVSSLDFGINEISNKEKIYYANAQVLNSGEGSKYVPNYAQISDNRGTNAGWKLTVKQEGQFANVAAQNKKLTGAQIKFVNPTVTGKTEVTPPTAAKEITLDPNGAESLVMSAKPKEGAGLWVNLWGQVDEMTNAEGEKVQKNKAISLSIPGKTPKDAVTYSTKLTWNLSDVPGNK
ncbi:WxL domain-containing protein [Lysinibacillus sp. NPDC094177]|uniref:WxL domain-containing protein n=1 Tax=Lysinibacillus sp. NPDC094177 TaxID=3390580 RepID=UPI003D0582BD